MPTLLRTLLFVLSACAQSHALTLTLTGDRFPVGNIVLVQWSRDASDPQSFGVMQRSLQTDSVLAVTPIANPSGESSGTVGVVFRTAGQVLLAPISQLSLSPGDTITQLEAGKQLTIVDSGSGNSDHQDSKPGPPPEETTTEKRPPTTTTTLLVTTTTTTKNTLSAIPTSNTGAAGTAGNENTTLIDGIVTDTKSTTTSNRGLFNSFVLSVIPEASTTRSNSLPAFKTLPASPSSSPSNESPSTESNSNATSGSNTTGRNRGLIGLAVILSLVFAALVGLFILRFILRRRREAQRAARMSRFGGWNTSDPYTSPNRGSWSSSGGGSRRERATIASFGFGTSSGQIQTQMTQVSQPETTYGHRPMDSGAWFYTDNAPLQLGPGELASPGRGPAFDTGFAGGEGQGAYAWDAAPGHR
ncbi:hypothetical protein MIND_00638100 [Mycena indigotica]|uniref:Mid2 domain-containing protein n=1 Tax=Mycena indigotica TaxID=2126181 RepID=A0A8H6W5Z4_9AGAR|nr:uncharacterized protein MIND_00638100 [Mycena indigotica]KAF7304066.1 hypothetical protein MIND_00638100 [Mycena indigotica]